MGNFLSGQMEADSLLLPFDPVPSLEEADSISFDFGMVPLPAIESLDSLEETPESVESQEPHNSNKRVKEERERTPDKPPASLKKKKGSPVKTETVLIHYDPSSRKGNAFAFTKEEVAEMTPHNLELYEGEVLAHHTLSTEEKTYLRKYKRQIRNRESAQNSRARKRQHVEVLEEQVAALTRERDELRQRVAQLEAEKAGGNSARPRMAGVVLVLVFSFGLLGMLQWPQHQNNGIPLGSSPSVMMAPQEGGAAGHRQLLEVAEVSDSPTPSPPPSPSPPARMKIVEVNESDGVPVTPMIRQHDKPSDYSMHWDRPNTDYLYCPAAHHVLSSTKDGASPSHVSLVLPSEAFNNSMILKEKAPPLVEVTCAVVDIWPVYLGNNNGLTAK